ncbi:tautomerase family protein [Auritidibacter ignavus]|uniref:tautomerase family protein n=1 Tax=Auritidibacter ignavus TaxID=678932 RepID=UPI003A5CC72B
MPLISVTHASAISDEQARKLIRSLTEAYATTTGANPTSIQVLITNVPADRWGIGGQTLTQRKR